MKNSYVINFFSLLGLNMLSFIFSIVLFVENGKMTDSLGMFLAVFAGTTAVLLKMLLEK